jgi:hypothetical protein
LVSCTVELVEKLEKLPAETNKYANATVCKKERKICEILSQLMGETPTEQKSAKGYYKGSVVFFCSKREERSLFQLRIFI